MTQHSQLQSDVDPTSEIDDIVYHISHATPLATANKN